MTSLKNAVLRQVAYAQAIRDIIRLILGRLLKGKWVEDIFASSDEEFLRKLDDALKTIDLRATTKKPYCEKIVAVLCDEVAELCETLHTVCEGRGYGEYFESHISHERFVRLVLSVDTVKLGRMRRIAENMELTPIELLRGIGAELNDEPLEVRLCARELRHANAELKSIAADVKSTMQTCFAQTNQKLIECKSGIAAVGEKVEAVAKTVETYAQRSRKHGKTHPEKKTEAVQTAWAVYLESATARMGVNTRPTSKGAFEYSKRQLELAGVTSLKEFCEIKHALRCREYRARLKSIEAARRKNQSAKQVKPPRKNDILRGR